MSLGKEEEAMILQGKLHIELPKLSSLILQCFHDEQGDVFPFVFGSKVSVSLPTIEKLGLLHCAFKEIFPAQAPGIDCTKILSQLKTLELLSLFQLKSIGLGHSWVIPLLQNLNTLLIWDCHCLTNLTPSTVSFSNLIKLNVKNCRKLKYLFTSSTAKTLVVLKEVCITNCKSLETIVADTDGDGLNEDNEVEEEGQREGNEDDVEEEGQGESEDEDDEYDDDDDDDESDGDEDENEGDRDEDDGVKEEEGQGGGELHEDKDKDEDKANANAEVDGDEDENEGGGDEDNDVEEKQKHGEGEDNKDKDKDDAEGDGDKDENKGDKDKDGGVEEEEGQGEGEDDQDEVKAYAKGEGEGDGDRNENAGECDNGGNECEDEITFKKLEILTLKSLPKLRSFYSGSSTLNFLSLEEMSLRKCCSAKLFRFGDKVPEKLRVEIDEFKRDMNSVFMQQDEAEAS